jgi:hypothetical protein
VFETAEELRSAGVRVLASKGDVANRLDAERAVAETMEKPDEGELFLDRSQIDLKTRVEIILDKQLIPWMIRQGDKVLITTGVIRELEDEIGDIGGLKSLAELLGWEYIPKKKLGKNVVSVMSVEKTDLVDFLSAVGEPSGEVEEDPGTGSSLIF